MRLMNMDAFTSSAYWEYSTTLLTPKLFSPSSVVAAAAAAISAERSRAISMTISPGSFVESVRPSTVLS